MTESIANPDDWPIYVDVVYDENGPSLVCDGWVKYRGHSTPCRYELSGSTVGQFREDLARHISLTQHVEHPLAEVNRQVMAAITQRRGGKIG